MQQLKVGLGDRSYPILIGQGILEGIGADLQQRSLCKRYFIVSDHQVAELYGAALADSLCRAGFPAEILTFPSGEGSKHLGTVGNLASRLASLSCDRQDGLIALGGGVSGDITGFLAAIYMRGIPFVQVPTTLLAQVDSSVGGKTGVDIPEGKNLIGAFYQPRCVYIDTGVLRSLPPAELLNGLAEIIKYGVIRDAGLFATLEEKRQAILDLDLQVLEQIVFRCCAIKAEVVEADEKEADLRRILNFGHTIGHAVEAASEYSLAHGAAVAIGMMAAARLAMKKKLLSENDAERLQDLLTAFGLPVEIPAELNRQLISEYLKTDKKAVEGRPFFVLPTRIGEVVITDQVAADQLAEIMALSQESIG